MSNDAESFYDTPEPPKVVIVGAGPAGLRAAEVLARPGIHPILIDENPLPGGWIYRDPEGELGAETPARFGVRVDRARRLHQAYQAIHDQVDWHFSTRAVAVRAGELDVTSEDGGETITFDALLLATGA